MKRVLRKVLSVILSAMIFTTLCTVNTSVLAADESTADQPASDVSAAVVSAAVELAIQSAYISSWYDAKKDYGAVGDGVTDDRPALQAAIDAASSAGGGVVWLPAGNYLLKATLNMKSNVSLKGVGQDVTKLTNGGVTGSALVYAPNCNKFSICDMTVESANVNNGIYITSCNSFRLENLIVNNAKNCGVAIYGTSSNGYMNNLYFYECGHTNTVSQYNQAIVMQGVDYSHPVTDMVITNCIAKQCGSEYNNGKNWEGGGFYAHWYSDRIKFSNCQVISGRKHGFKMQGRHIQITNCQVIDNGSGGFGYGFSIQGPWFQGSNLSVVNSTRSGWGVEIYVSPVYPADVESRYELSNIEVINVKCGIGIYGAGVGGRTHTLRDIAISDFTIRDSDMWGILVSGGVQDVFISNGNIYNCGYGDDGFGTNTGAAALEIKPAGTTYPNRVFVDNVVSRSNYRGVKADNSGAANPYGILNVISFDNTNENSYLGNWQSYKMYDIHNDTPGDKNKEQKEEKGQKEE